MRPTCPQDSNKTQCFRAFSIIGGLTLRSRWTTPIWWQWSTASRICWMQWLHANTRGPWVSDKLPLYCRWLWARFDTRGAASGHVLQGDSAAMWYPSPSPSINPAAIIRGTLAKWNIKFDMLPQKARTGLHCCRLLSQHGQSSARIPNLKTEMVLAPGQLEVGEWGGRRT